jgi:hypothetical protein
MILGGAPAVPLLGPFGLVVLAASFLLGGFLMQGRRRLSWFSTVGAIGLMVVPMAALATVTLPNVFVNGQIGDADEVNANFDTLTTTVNYRTIARATALGPFDTTDSGVIASRVLVVVKDQSDTALRIGYTDKFRVFEGGGTPVGCTWEVPANGASCPGGALAYGYFVAPGSTGIHRQGSVVGYCEGLAAGPHTLQVYLDNTLVGGVGSS